MGLESEKIIQNQNKILEVVRKEPSYLNYWNSFRKIKKIDFSSLKIKKNQKIRVALLSSFTIDPLEAFLDIDCRLIELFPELYITPFNRYNESIFNKTSKLYKFNPDIIFFFIELESLLDNKFKEEFVKRDFETLEDEIIRITNQIEETINSLSQNSKSLIIFSNFIVPSFSPLGILDNKRKIGIRKFYRLINEKIENIFINNEQVFVFDLNEATNNYGKDNVFDYSSYYRGSMLFSQSFLPKLSYKLMGYIKALKSKNRKCLVLDLDNTLWGGIIGEDGIDGIKLNINNPGNEFVDFQRSIVSLYNRGIILAVNSKNNREDALEVFQKHPYMLVKEDYLASYKINWMDKVHNIIELAKDINIGLDSMIFIDDNPVERARVKEALPEVLVVDMPKNTYLYKTTLENLNDFDTFSITKEDLTRGEKYYKRRKRQDLEKQVQSVDDFIQSLQLVAKIKFVDSFALQRVTSLINKTNQFNLTTKRYTAVEIEKMKKDQKNYSIYTLEVKDKFGDEGIVGVAIISKDTAKIWTIDSFLMSCRVIGRKIETAFLYKIINDGVKQKIEQIIASYIPTKKNPLVKDFFNNHNFEFKEEKTDGERVFIYKDLQRIKEYPKYLQVNEE